jgi:hypothetical protein
MPHLITAFYKARKRTGSDGYETYAIRKDPADWLIEALTNHSEVDTYYEKPRIVFSTPITEEQYSVLTANL